jgi:hypothetical protein
MHSASAGALPRLDRAHSGAEQSERERHMNLDQRTGAHIARKLGLITAGLGLALLLICAAEAQTTFGGNAQHTAKYSPVSRT